MHMSEGTFSHGVALFILGPFSLVVHCMIFFYLSTKTFVMGTH